MMTKASVTATSQPQDGGRPRNNHDRPGTMTMCSGLITVGEELMMGQETMTMPQE